MRSASSKTKNDTLDKSTVPNLIWDNKRPGGAITISAPISKPLFCCSQAIPSVPPYTATADTEGIK